MIWEDFKEFIKDAPLFAVAFMLFAIVSVPTILIFLFITDPIVTLTTSSILGLFVLLAWFLKKVI